MIRTIAAGILVATVCAIAANAQSADPKTVFEVVSIKPSTPPDPGRGIRVAMRGGPGSSDPGRATFENFSLTNLVTIAYGINNYQLSGADGLDNVRFDITAKIPDSATKEDFQLMMQSMLAERFKLTVGHQKKEIQTWRLIVAKNGPKLTPSVQDAPPPDVGPRTPRPAPSIGSDGFPVLPPGPGMAMMNGRARMQMLKTTMEQLAGRLTSQMGAPVADATGLKGEYDFSLFWMTESMRAGPSPAISPDGGAIVADPDSGPTLLTALQDQLGLRLESVRGQVDVVVIEHIEKVPTGN